MGRIVTKFAHTLHRQQPDDEEMTAIEHAIIASLVALAIIAGATALG